MTRLVLLAGEESNDDEEDVPPLGKPGEVGGAHENQECGGGGRAEDSEAGKYEIRRE